MKGIIIVLIVGFLLSKAYESYEKTHPSISNSLSSATLDVSQNTVDNALSSVNYKCDGRTHCSQMTSCDEAVFFLRNCPNVEMDGNNDGEPC
jgi:hypothetical protein